MVDVVKPSRFGTSYVEWGAVFAGALAASAISFVLLTAGAAIGLSLVSPYESESYGRLAGLLAVFWSIAVPILAFLVGGYIAGRMRSAWDAAASDEVQFRDGIHGLLVWSLSVVAGGMLAFLATATVAQTGAHVAASGMSDRGAVVAPAVDTLFGASVAQAAAAPAGEPEATPAAPAGRAAVLDADARSAVSRTLVAAVAAGQLAPSRKQTLAKIVADRTGLSQAEAEKRVDQAYAESKNAVEKARQVAVLAGLGTVTALLVGLLAAWYAAQRGGHHRDHNIPARVVLSRRRPSVGIR
jgi:hypothetical protein